jgi:uncharacterized membrane protein (UPF0136 family)
MIVAFSPAANAAVASSARRPVLVARGAATQRPAIHLLLRQARQPQQQHRAPAIGGGGGSGGGGSGGSGGGGNGNDGSNNDPHPLRPFTFAYAAFLLVGGVVAYAKSQSTKSLTAAGGSAVVLALCARGMTGGPAATRGPLMVVAALSAALAYVMAKRYNKTGKVMPAGVTAGLSFGMAIASVQAIGAAASREF